MRTWRAADGPSYIVRFTWREWSLGLGIVFGTLAFQFYAHLGPLHGYLWLDRKRRA